MKKDFNLIISTARRHETDSCAEVWFLLSEIGDTESFVRRTYVSGLIIAKTSLDPFKAIEYLRRILKRRPDEFRYTFRFIPIELVVRTEIKRIKDACLKLSSKILESETFRVTVEKRHTSLLSKNIVDSVAEGVKRGVDLENPDKIVLVEVLGGITGVSIIKPNDILSVVREKDH